jgi:hypothetical protein
MTTPFGKAWFQPKRYGLGATPSTWEGWLVTLVFVGAFAGDPFVFGRTISILIAVILVAALLVIVWAKTDGGWRWRWGGKD